MMGSGNVDNDIELVRRGFDPSQVQQLVGQLSGELKTMAAENDQLRARVAELEASARPVPTTTNDIFTHWSKETNDLMDAARASIRSVTERATSDAASALAAGETAATAIRQRAQIDAEGILAEARRQAEESAAGAAAERARIEAEAQANVARANAQVAALESKLTELRGQRSAMSQQLTTAKSHLLQLMSLVEEPEASAAAAGSSPISVPNLGVATYPAPADAAHSSGATSEEAPTADEQP
jgi:cell division septum initiation protein DivIVA